MSSAAALLKDGQEFAARYHVVKCLNSGGMGAVFEATHKETGRRCALKVMLPHIVFDESMRERFKREARITASIESDFIVDVLDAGVDEDTGLPFIVMEFLVGEDLGAVVDKTGKMPFRDVVTLLHQTALALNKTHDQNIVHRDLKPENLFLTQRDDGSPHIKILDFGISKVIADSGTQANQTQNLGTPTYMAPEQFQGRVSPATDIYALGMIAYTLLVGVSYWHAEIESEETVFSLATKIMRGTEEAATVRAQARGVILPPAFDAFFAKATAAKPTDRHASALEMVNALAVSLALPPPHKARGEMASVPMMDHEERVRIASGPTIDSGSMLPAAPAATGVAPGLSGTQLTAASDSDTKKVGKAKSILPIAIAAGVAALIGVVGFAMIVRPNNQAPVPATSVNDKAPGLVNTAGILPPTTASTAAVTTAAPPSASVTLTPAVPTSNPVSGTGGGNKKTTPTSTATSKGGGSGDDLGRL